MRSWNGFKCKRWLVTVNRKNSIQSTLHWRKISHAIFLLSGKCRFVLKLHEYHELGKSETLFRSLGLSNIGIWRLQGQRTARKGTITQLIASYGTQRQLPCSILSLRMRRKHELHPYFTVYTIHWIQSNHPPPPAVSMSQVLPVKKRKKKKEEQTNKLNACRIVWQLVIWTTFDYKSLYVHKAGATASFEVRLENPRSSWALWSIWKVSEFLLVVSFSQAPEEPAKEDVGAPSQFWRLKRRRPSAGKDTGRICELYSVMRVRSRRKSFVSARIWRLILREKWVSEEGLGLAWAKFIHI